MTRHRLIWPLLSIVALLLTNLLISPGFFSINMRGGHLYGSLIDIISFGAPLMLVALGMTLVIATGGIDLSVGAVAAISGACACLLISKAEDQNSLATVLLAIAAALGLSMLCGLWNGLLVAVIGIQPFVATLILMVAGRGIAQLITTGQIITIDELALQADRRRIPVCAPLLDLHRGRRLRRHRAPDAADGARHADRGGRWKQGSEPAGRGSVARADHPRVRVLGTLRRHRRGDDQLDRVRRRREQRGLWIELDAILAVVIGGTALAGGRFFLAGTIIGAVLIQTLITTIYSIGIPPETNLLFKALVVTLVCLIQSPAFRAEGVSPASTSRRCSPTRPSRPTTSPSR